MSPAADPPPPSLSAAGFTDGLGRRSLCFDREVGGMLERLDVRPEFSLYESVLRDGARRLEPVTDRRIVRPAAIVREGRALTVLSPLPPGERLEELLDARAGDESGGAGLDAALGFLLQGLPVLRSLHKAGIVHGTLAPGRIAISAAGDVVLLDCIYGGPLELLRASPARLWTAFSLIVPTTAGGARFDRAFDLRQLTLCALAIALGRSWRGSPVAPAPDTMLREVGDVAQIRGGNRFAEDVAALFGQAASGSQMSLEGALTRTERLVDAIGRSACFDALVSLTRTPADAALEAVRPTALVPGPISLPSAAAATRGPGDELILDVSGSVEISLDGLSDVTITDLSSVGIGTDELFDWHPEPIPDPPAVTSAMGQQPTPAVPGDADPYAESHPYPLVSEGPTDGFGDPPIAEPPIPLPGIPLLQTVSAPPATSQPSRTETNAANHSLVSAPPVTPSRPAASLAGATSTHSIAPSGDVAPSPPIQPNQAAPPTSTVAVPVSVSGAASVPIFPAPVPVPYVPVPPPTSFGPPQPVVVAPPQPVIPVPSPAAFRPAPPVQPLGPPAAAAQPGASPPLRLKAPEHAVTRPTRLLDVDQSAATAAVRQARGRSRRTWAYAAALAAIAIAGAFLGRPWIQGLSEARAAAEPERPTSAPAVQAEASVGGLHIDTQPAGAVVQLNGEDVGRTPLKLDAVKPGRYTVTVSTDSATVKRAVRVEAGKVVTLDLPVYSGWVAIYSPVRLHVSEGGRSLGTTETTRLMLSPGRHELTLVNRELGYSTRQTVDIVPGEERVLNIEPRGTIAVNALPWAEVWVDGVRMGETPLANLEVPLGTREFVFKHPTYGERRITTTVTASAPPISVDLTRSGGGRP